MKKLTGISTILFITIIFTFLYSEPSFNGNTPGCAGSSCHDYNAGNVSALPAGDMQIEVSLNNVSQGEKVGGELVDNNGNVVDVVQSTENNPFMLTAPSAGTYLVNAGYKKPSRDWDSVSVTLNVSAIDAPLSTGMPDKIELLGNHPNPFNNITLIKFSLPHQSNIKLAIFSINGRLIRVLSDDSYMGGVHQVMWDGKDTNGKTVASGTYVYQLTSEQQQISRKLVLAK